MTESTPLVFIGVLAYNRARGLQNTLAALLAQSYSNIEIHVSDDASPDPEVKAVMQRFAQADSRIKIHFQNDNLGIINNHKFLLSKIPHAATYVAWACDDDDWHQDFVKVCVQALNKNPKVLLAYTATRQWLQYKKQYQVDDHSSANTLSFTDPIQRFKKVLSNILWQNHAFYGVLRRTAYHKVALRNVFVFDVVFVAQLSLHGEFIKLPQPYFRKKSGGHGSDLGRNLTAIKQHRIGNRLFPKLCFFFSLAQMLRASTLLNVEQKRQLILYSLLAVLKERMYQNKLREGLLFLPLKIVGVLKFLKVWRHIDHLNLAWLIHIHKLPASDFELDRKNQRVLSHRLGLAFELNDSLFGSYFQLRRLKEHHAAGLTFEQKTNSNIIEISGVSLELKDSDHGFLVNEVFVEKRYDFDDALPSIVIDIGSKGAATALYFAQKPQVKVVYAFVDAVTTADINLQRNPRLMQKVSLECLALTDVIDMTAPNISQRLRLILVKHEQERKVLKLDIQGREIDFIKDLIANKLLNDFEVIMIDWHSKEEHKSLTALLEQAFDGREFHFRSSDPCLDVGVIYLERMANVAL